MTVIHPFPPPPPVVNSGKSVRMVDPARLTQHQRQWLWRGIQQRDPALAELLKTDDNITQ